MSYKQRLELDWIGKDEDTLLEPRILVEDEKLNVGNSKENLLIHGDNLLSLKALEAEFKQKIKCIFIDPPYNTGNAFEHYDDGLEHSTWLSLMSSRLKILRNLLSDDGSIWIIIDDNEGHYLKVLCDEIFGRNCFVSTVIWRSTDNSNNNAKTFSMDHNYILVYSKQPGWQPVFLNDPSKRKHFKNPDNDPRGPWFDGNPVNNPALRPNLQFNLEAPNGNIINHPPNGWRWSKETIDAKLATGELRFSDDGTRLIRRTYLRDQKGLPPSTLWTNLDETSHNRAAKYELKGLFPDYKVTDLFGTPKPEKLIKRVLEHATEEGDYVLDSFAGSGTTPAVAHKMKRRWIAIELKEHIYEFVLPRLTKVVEGKDEGGVTNECEWTGGGGFSFSKLAPSLLRKDDRGNWVINNEYDAKMLAEAVCKHEKFVFFPDEVEYWKQGYSSENDFIFVTTQFLTSEHLDRIASKMKKSESLLICAKAFRVKKDKYPNITLKKIPQMLLGRCEFDKDDYSLNIIEEAQEEFEMDMDARG